MVDSDALEQEILDFWEREKIFAKSLEQNKDKQPFVFYDGPPYATGKPHYGHILQSSIKDTVLRYKTMQGYYVPRRVGWDCHGLPVETLVEKELGITSKREIEKDIEGFNKKCRETVYRYVDVFTNTLQRIGRWADYDNAYATLDRDYMESEWWVFKQLWEQELIYKDFRSTPYCIRCATPLSNWELGMGYKEKTDTAVYVLISVKRKEKSKKEGKPLYLMIWTTTPWTLPGNAAVAISPELEYVTVDHGGKRIVVAKDRVAAVCGKEAAVQATWKTDDLLQLTYEPLFDVAVPAKTREQAYRVVAGEHVTAQEGTGLVHIAPAFGEEDFQIGAAHGLPTLRTVDPLGNFTDDVPLWAGENIFTSNGKIVSYLEEHGLLFKRENYIHSYPFCWRCDTPLIYYALDTWFIKVTALKQAMLENNEQISWIPEHIKHGRFAKGIESAPDWAVSRNRFWSVPIPIWDCDSCGERAVIGSLAELQKRSGATDDQVVDIHRPYVDTLSWPCTKCGGVMKRVAEVLDVWFDSGAMPYSQWHYPFEKKEFVAKTFPADLIVESIEMTRAWFFFLHVLAAALTRTDTGLGQHKPAFASAIASGLIFAEDGQKLSKKMKNYPEPEPIIQKYGADVLRLYLLSSTSLGEPYRFLEKDVRQLRQNTYMRLWNVYSFFTRYANVRLWQPDRLPASQNLLDLWIGARTKQLEAEVIEHTNKFHVDIASRLFIPFVDDLSNWYVRRSRVRFQHNAADKDVREAFSTLYSVLVRVSKLLAPFMPFAAEEIYRNLTQEQSVHLATLIEPPPLSGEESDLLQAMARARAVVTTGLSLRAKAHIKVRQPLSTLLIASEKLSEELVEMIRDEVNVKEVSFGPVPKQEGYVKSEEDGPVQAAIDIKISSELAEEGLVREVIRQGQRLRREAGFKLDDRIRFIVRSGDAKTNDMLDKHRAEIQQALQADEVLEGGKEDAGQDIQLGDNKVHLGVCKS